jgi:hypothetical protein
MRKETSANFDEEEEEKERRRRRRIMFYSTSIPNNAYTISMPNK